MQKILGSSLEIARIQSEINRLFQSLLELKQPGDEAGQTWMPNTDIIDGPEAVTVLVELPGVALADLSLQADGGNIILEGRKRPVESPAGTDRHHLLERSFGAFRRVISLNYPINTHRARARLVAGVLRISFPKVENRRGGAVPIPVEET